MARNARVPRERNLNHGRRLGEIVVLRGGLSGFLVSVRSDESTAEIAPEEQFRARDSTFADESH